MLSRALKEGLWPEGYRQFFFSLLCWAEAMMIYSDDQQGSRERLRGEEDEINFVDLRF